MVSDSLSEPATDIILVGGGLIGCLTAVAAAQQGKKVVLVESRSYLGRELTATLRPWVLRSAVEAIPAQLAPVFFPDGEAEAIDVDLDALPPWCREEHPLFCGSIKKGLLALLQAEGVTVLFMTHVSGLLMQGGMVTGVLLTNKHGLQALRACAVVDATEGRFVASLAGVSSAEDNALRRYTVGFTNASMPTTPELAVPQRIGVRGDTARVHAGKNRSCNAYVELAFEPAAGTRTALARQAAIEQQARRLAVDVAAHLIGNVPEFGQATVAEFAAETIAEAPGGETASASLPQGLLAVPPGVSAVRQARDWARLEAASATSAAEAVAVAENAPLPDPSSTAIRFGDVNVPLSDCHVSAFDDPGLALPLESIELLDSNVLPVLDGCDVLVAGGGTAGACAAIAAAEDGADVVVVDANADLGGTQTVGLVAGYYHGYCGGFTKELDARASALGKKIHSGKREGLRRIAKMLCYEDALINAGGRWYANTVICGSLAQGGDVHGILIGSQFGLARVEATVTMDATGDGDVAAFCGAQMTFGNPRNGNAQDYSQWSKGTGGRQSKAQDLDVIDQRYLSEMLRGLTIAHQKGFWFDFASMLTAREGRHVVGEYTLDMRDILDGRRFEDAIAFANTDWDPHGISSSDLGRLGFLPVHMETLPTQIPFRCCIPKSLNGLLVTAKAISATTDAACLCRMAADVQNLGYATGLAAALTAKADGNPRAIDLKSVRKRLLQNGVLPGPADAPPAPDRGTPAERIQRLAAGDETALLDVALLPAETALPLLRATWTEGDGNRIELAKALAWYGDPRGQATLVAELERLVVGEGASAYDDTHPHKAGNPKAGIVDDSDDYWRINQLLTLVGRARATKALPAVAQVIDLAWSGGEPVRDFNSYIKVRIDMQRVPHFDRLLCIAYSAERLAAPELIPPLDRLLDRKFITGNTSTTPAEAGPNYHSAYVEVQLAAAAMRCGSIAGGQRLIEYLGDIHSILKLFAHGELVAVSGKDVGLAREAWREWLAKQVKLLPVPYENNGPVF